MLEERKKESGWELKNRRDLCLLVKKKQQREGNREAREDLYISKYCVV